MKTQVYSWRLAEETKSDLERAARARKLSISAILDLAVRDWLSKADTSAAGEQEKLQTAAAKCFGSIAGGNPRRSRTVREAVRDRLRNRHGR